MNNFSFKKWILYIGVTFIVVAYLTELFGYSFRGIWLEIFIPYVTTYVLPWIILYWLIRFVKAFEGKK